MAKTILVTGGAGFIGSHTCEELLKSGYKVTAIDDFNGYYDPKVKEENIAGIKDNFNFRLYRADITDFKALQAIFGKEKFDAIVHLAARAGVRPSIENPQLYAHVNVDGTANLLELAKEHGINQFVFGSSSSVYGVNKKVPFSECDDVGNMVSPYAVTKRAGELLCSCYHNLYGINIACLRFFTVYGPRGRPDMAPYMFTSRIMRGQPIDKFGGGSTKRDYTYVSDIVFGIKMALKVKGFEILNLGNNKPISLNRFIQTIEGIVGRKAVIRKKPMQKGDVPVTYADISKSYRLLGYKPKVSIEEGLTTLHGWLKNGL